MCKMWEKIRFGARWNPGLRTGLAARGINLKNVQSIQLSMDPFHSGNESIRWFWSIVTSRHVQRTNLRTKIECRVVNDRTPPHFTAKISNGQTLLFKTEGMHIMDLIMTFNRLLGNPEFGKSGIRPLPKVE